MSTPTGGGSSTTSKTLMQKLSRKGSATSSKFSFHNIKFSKKDNRESSNNETPDETDEDNGLGSSALLGKSVESAGSTGRSTGLSWSNFRRKGKKGAGGEPSAAASASEASVTGDEDDASREEE